ncbi:hypothetical protein FB385_3156 [Paramicrobacterium agarici]|nr:hypothetical protein FB385_3156 [Microbacterium agarici]
MGPKGAGKSASLEHLALQWDGRSDRFLKRWELASFPVADITTIRVGAQPGPSSTRAAWEFLLLLRLFESLVSDQGAHLGSGVVGFHKSLVGAGLVGGPDLRTRFFDWSKTTMRFNVGVLSGESSSTDSEVTALQIVEILKKAISSIQTSSRHLLAIDGLDSFFAESESQRESLGSLLDASYEINSFLRDVGLPCTVLLAIRHDMFAQVPSTDSAKYGDHTVELDWSCGGTSSGDELWKLVSTKAKASVPPSFKGLPLGDLRKAYLAEPIGVGPYKNMPSWLLSYTRMLPRDLVALMNEVKRVHKGSGQLRESEAKIAVRRYCETYFVREIGNNLSRLIPQGAFKVETLLDALSAMSSREFNVRSLQPEIDGLIDQTELRILLKQMFNVGALGVRRKSGGKMHTNFVYRRTAGGGFSFIADYVLHNALVEAWNLNW